MSEQVVVRCRCGTVEGHLTDVSPDSVNRVTCYCADCQAFARFLGRTDLLDAQGGSDVVQVAPASLMFSQGSQRIRCVRLSSKGLFRFYAGCCNSPLGNVLGPGIPFIGVIVQTICAERKNANELFGASRGMIHGKYALGIPPEGSTSLNLGLIARALLLVLTWRVRGKQWPHPFFDRTTRGPVYPVQILSPAERETFRIHEG